MHAILFTNSQHKNRCSVRSYLKRNNYRKVLCLNTETIALVGKQRFSLASAGKEEEEKREINKMK